MAWAGCGVEMVILIVEDEPKVAEGLRAYFEVSGHQVVLSDTGQEAIGLVEQQHPDVALVDLWLKDKVSGLDVLRASRQRSPKTVVIIVTGLEEDAATDEAMQAGALAVLRKPIQLDQLDDLVTHIHEQRSAKA